MPKEEEKEAQKEQVELTEEQRIAKLEKQAGTNKMLLLITALLMLIITTITITAFVLILSKISKPVQQVNSASSSQELSDLIKQVESQKSQLATFSVNLSELEGKVSNSSNATIQAALIGLEKDNQKFLSALRSGVYDLAHMVPGSRTWLELYSEQIDETIAHSQARQESLKKLQTSEVLNKEEAFFGDDF